MNSRLEKGWKIDEVFRQGLEELRPEPSENLWKNINRKLWWNEISHFTFTNLSKLLMIGGIVLIMTMITALMVVIVPQQNNPDESNLSLFTSEVSASNGLTIPVSSIHKSPGLQESILRHNDASTSTEQAMTRPAPRPRISLATILAAEEPDEPNETVISEKESATLISTDESGREKRDESLITTLPLKIEDNFLNMEGYDLSGYIPSLIGTLDSRPLVPTFFSFDLKVAPESVFNESTTDNVTMSFSGDLGLKFHIGRFSIGTGLGIDYETSDGIYTVDYISNDSVGYYTEVIYYAISEQDPSKVNFITRNVTVYDSIMHIADDRTRNRYTYLHIPVLAGFRLFETSRLGLTAYAGPMISFLAGKREAEPVITYPNARIIRIDNNTPPRNKTTWQVLIGLRLDYKLAREFSVFAEPYYKYYLQPIVIQSESPATKPWSVGLGVGIQYNFGRKITAK